MSKGLSTDAGTSWLGFLILVYNGISQMPEGNIKATLHFAILIVAAVVAFAIKGSGITPEQGKQILDTHEEIKDVLARGRDEK